MPSSTFCECPESIQIAHWGFSTNMCRYFRFSIDGKFVINFNQVASYTATTTPSQRHFPAKRSVIISHGMLNSQAAAALFPDPSQKIANPLGFSRSMTQQCTTLGDCLEALHARTSRLVQTPTSIYFKASSTTSVPLSPAYDNEVLLEPIFTALPAMEHLVTIIIPFSQPLTITSSLGLGLQNRWIPDET